MILPNRQAWGVLRQSVSRKKQKSWGTRNFSLLGNLLAALHVREVWAWAFPKTFRSCWGFSLWLRMLHSNSNIERNIHLIASTRFGIEPCESLNRQAWKNEPNKTKCISWAHIQAVKKRQTASSEHDCQNEKFSYQAVKSPAAKLQGRVRSDSQTTCTFQCRCSLLQKRVVSAPRQKLLRRSFCRSGTPGFWNTANLTGLCAFYGCLVPGARSGVPHALNECWWSSQWGWDMPAPKKRNVQSKSAADKSRSVRQEKKGISSQGSRIYAAIIMPFVSFSL